MVIQDLDTVCSLIWRSFLVDDQLVAFEKGGLQIGIRVSRLRVVSKYELYIEACIWLMNWCFQQWALS